jgi:hypothetical protein
MRRLLANGFICSAVALAVAVPVRGREPLNADDVLKKQIEAIGGAAANQKCHNRVVRGTISIRGVGTNWAVLSGPFVSYTAEPGKSYAMMDIKGIGKEEAGTIRGVAWARGAHAGAGRILQGKEKEIALREATFHADVDWKAAYQNAEYVGEEKVEGRACHAVRFTTANGDATTSYFNKDTGLLDKAEKMIVHDTGKLTAEVYFSDYKAVAGLLVPHKERIEVWGQQEIIFTSDTVEHNVYGIDSRFELPADIKRLLDRETKKRLER